MPVCRLLIPPRDLKACSTSSSGTHQAVGGGTVVPFRRPSGPGPGPAGDVAFWRELAFRSEAFGDIEPAVSYWQAAIAAAKLLAPSVKGDAELKWLRDRLTRATAVVKHVAGDAAAQTVH